MALKGGSLIVGATATRLSAAVPGKVTCLTMSFNCPQANAGAVTVGDSSVQADGNPGYFTITPGGSYTPPPPLGRPFDVDMGTLYAVSTAGTEVIQIVYVN